MTISDWVIVLAVLIAPLSAVQVQKIIERLREARTRKLLIFKTLMATRAATISPEHVRALNMIDLEFKGRKYTGVADAWKTYLDHQFNYPKEDEKLQAVWSEKRSDFLARLLMLMGKSFGYSFDEVHIKKGIYAPQAHAQTEDEHLLIRRGIIRLLYGEAGLKMDITSLPANEDEAKEQKLLRKGLIDLLKGKKVLPIKMEPKDEA